MTHSEMFGTHLTDTVFISGEVHPRTNSQVFNTEECERGVLLSTHTPLTRERGRERDGGPGEVKGQRLRDHCPLRQHGFEWALLSRTG